MDFVKFTKVPHLMILYPLFDLFYQQLVPVATTLQKVFVPVLEKFTINEYTVKDPFSFCKEILDQDPNLLLASFDIQSLFTKYILG